MPDFDYQLSVEASAEDRNAIERGLELYNERFIGADHYKPLHIVMRDDTGAVVGGLIGGTYWNWLYIRIMWVSDACRKSGAGTRLLELAEAEAIQRGCKNVHLDTFDFQALGFYNKRGYSVWGRLDAFAGDYTRYFLRKQL
jgi:GNAT superfamily N-acetyltransferase